MLGVQTASWQLSVPLHRSPSLHTVPFTSGVPNVVERAAAALDYSRMRILSGAGHDAMHLAKVCPTGMIFVPCERGVSHNETENATPADLAAGTRVLASALVELADA